MKRTIVDGRTLLRQVNEASKEFPCPVCKAMCHVHSFAHRWVRDAHPKQAYVLEITTSKHHCYACKKYFTKPTKFAPPNSGFSYRVHRLAVELIVSKKLGFKQASKSMFDDYHVSIPPTTLHDWVVEGKWGPQKLEQQPG